MTAEGRVFTAQDSEVERLRAADAANIVLLQGNVEEMDRLKSRMVQAEAEVERLRAENQRLTDDALSSAPPYYRHWQQAEARLAKVVEAAKQLFTSIETIERQAEVLARRVQDDRPVETILFECKRTRAALLAAAQPEEE